MWSILSDFSADCDRFTKVLLPTLIITSLSGSTVHLGPLGLQHTRPGTADRLVIDRKSRKVKVVAKSESVGENKRNNVRLRNRRQQEMDKFASRERRNHTCLRVPPLQGDSLGGSGAVLDRGGAQMLQRISGEDTCLAVDTRKHPGQDGSGAPHTRHRRCADPGRKGSLSSLDFFRSRQSRNPV